MGSPFLILAHSFKKESLGRSTTLANSFLPHSLLVLVGLIKDQFLSWIRLRNV